MALANAFFKEKDNRLIDLDITKCKISMKAEEALFDSFEEEHNNLKYLRLSQLKLCSRSIQKLANHLKNYEGSKLISLDVSHNNLA